MHTLWKVLLVQLLLILSFYGLNSTYTNHVVAERNQNLLFYIEKNHQILGDHTNKGEESLPRRLRIPQINVNARIQSVGVTIEGAMETPNNTSDVGWFHLGPRPGGIGSAVIAGHVDGEKGEAAVFSDLSVLSLGSKIYVDDNEGNTTTFIVRSIRSYDPGYAEEVFSSDDSAHLNLITCDGIWDQAQKSFTKRLVVFADKESDRAQ